MKNKLILPLLTIGIVLLVTIPLFILFVRPSSQELVPVEFGPIPTQFQPQISPYTGLKQLVSADPAQDVILFPGEKYDFTFVFTSPLPQNIFVSLHSLEIGGTDEKETVPFTSRISPDRKTITLTPNKEINPSQQIILSIADEKTIIFSTTYASERIRITPAPSNNPELKQYLPYETETYILSFSTRRSSYIFNLKLIENSPNSLEEQYQSAKSQAEAFIQSKGIDIDSLSIEWRRS